MRGYSGKRTSGAESELARLRRYLVLNEETDLAECYDWYTFLKAARWLGVAPWVLSEQSIYWREKAVIAMNAEAQAQEVINERNNKPK